MSTYLPDSAESARQHVARCYLERRSIRLSGAGTRAGAHKSDELSTRSLRQWFFLNPDDMVLGVAAGVPLAEIHERLAAVGMSLPLASWFTGATLGGVVAANEWGPQRLERGGVRDHIIGIEYVDGQGRLVKSGGKVVKNVTGYDLGKLMIGSLGGLGLITSVNLKLNPAPLAPQRAQFRMRGNHWLSWLRDEIHLSALPLDWFQAIYREGEWQLAMGFSGLPARRARIAEQLCRAFSNELIFQDDTETSTPPGFHGEDFTPPTRQHGFLERHRLAIGSDYFHLHVIAPSSVFFEKQRLHEALLAIPETTTVLHPVGGDAHLLGPGSALNEQHIDQLRRALAGSGGYLVLEHVAAPLLKTFSYSVPLPSEYPIQQRLKKQLDPRNIFHAPYYTQI